jgi:hypothetical protein
LNCPRRQKHVTDELPVRINREGRRELDVPGSIEVTGSFDVRFVNHGEALHVHLATSDGLSRVVTVDAGNRHVPGNGERRVRIDVDTDAIAGEAAYGQLDVSTGYGAEERGIDVEVRDPATVRTAVDVDDSLASPPRDDVTLFDRPELVVLGLGLLAVVLAATTAAVVDSGLAVAGVGVVLVGLVVALGYVLR